MATCTSPTVRRWSPTPTHAAVSRRPRSDRSVALGRSRTAGPSRQRRAGHRGSADDRVRAQLAEAESRNEGAQLDAAAAKRGVRPGSNRGQTGVSRGRRSPPRSTSGADADTQTHVPALLQAGSTGHRHVEPPRVRRQPSGHAVYIGNSRLWQGDTKINGDTIVVDDKTGNLEATHERAYGDDDGRRGSRRRPCASPPKSTGESETFVYDDAKRLATYTGKAHLIGSQGDIDRREARTLSWRRTPTNSNARRATARTATSSSRRAAGSPPARDSRISRRTRRIT